MHALSRLFSLAKLQHSVVFALWLKASSRRTDHRPLEVGMPCAIAARDGLRLFVWSAYGLRT